MTRPETPLRHHLLTRSDLARMAVPAAEVLSWLSSGAIEQIGVLPDGGAGTPAFAVLTPELRLDLLARLARIDKPAAVLAPVRVRSFLLRATLVGAPPEAAANLPDADLANVFAEAAEHLAADAATLLRVASEEAALEAAELAESAGSAAGEAADGGEPTAEDALLDDAAAPDDDADACFDADDLAAAFGDFEEPVATSAERAEAVAARPIEAAAPAAIAPPEVAEPDESAEEPFTSEPGPLHVEVVRDAPAPPPPPPPPPLQPQPPVPAANVAKATVLAPAPAAAVVDAVPVERVQTMIADLKATVVEIARRPAPPIDIRPFVQVVQVGLDRSAAQASATAAALESLHARVDGVDRHVAGLVARPPVVVNTIAPRATRAARGAPAATHHTMLAGLAVVAVAWAFLFWFMLDSPRLAIGTLIGANIAGCALLLPRTNHRA